MALFSRGFIGQKLALFGKLSISPHAKISEKRNILSVFAYESVLIPNPTVLDAEFNSLSDGVIFKGGHVAKTKGSSQNTTKIRSFLE